MNFPRSITAVSVFTIMAAVLLTACQKNNADPAGIWRGFVKNNSGEEVAFTLEVKRDGDKIIGSLVNGNDRTTSTNGSFDGKTLQLSYDFYDAELNATIDGDELSGSFTRQWRKQSLKRELSARRDGADSKPSSSSVNANADLSGEWVLRVGDAPKQSLWRAAFRQNGNEMTGTIIPVSGDWGELVGTFENGQLKLNRFDGINCRIFKARLTPQGTLEGIVDLGLLDPVRKVVAERIDESNKGSVAALPNPSNYTRMVNPNEPFRFGFTDLDGNLVSSTDERFRNKVVVVSITGSWCPNCYEETPFLQGLYERYHDKGLEAVALAFEYTGETQRDLDQVKIFAKRHKVTYPILLAGSTEEGELQRKLPQLVNFGGYPTTIFIGRDGLVKRIHTGFEGKATGDRFIKLKAEYEGMIKELLDGS